MDYMIVVADDIYSLEKKVDAAMKKGYIPTGGVSTSRWHNYMQPVYKEVK